MHHYQAAGLVSSTSFSSMASSSTKSTGKAACTLHPSRFCDKSDKSFPFPATLAAIRKSIAEMIKTRTVVQVRTHAQKYFAKQKKRLQLETDGLSSSYYSHSTSTSSSNSLSSNASDDNDTITRRYKKNSKRGVPSGSVATGLTITLPGRYSRSSSFASSTATDSAATTPRLRKRNSQFFDDDSNDGSDSLAPTATPRRTMARMQSHTPPASVVLAPVLSSLDPVDLAFDADFRANIIASDLNIDGLAPDVTALLAPVQNNEWLRSGACEDDNETTVDNYSPVSSASTSGDDLQEHEYNTLSTMYSGTIVLELGGYPEPERALDPTFGNLDSFMAEF